MCSYRFIFRTSGVTLENLPLHNTFVVLLVHMFNLVHAFNLFPDNKHIMQTTGIVMYV